MGDPERENTLIDEVRENFTLKTLQERVWRLESENKELKVNNSILQTQYTSQCETQSEILRTLHQNLEENITKIEELELKIQSLQEQLADQKQQAKDELEAQKAQWETRVTELQMKNEHLDTELQKVEEFRQNKADMEAELALKSRQLKEQAEEHQRQVSVFDRNKAMEIDQIRKDMKQQIKETRDMLKSRTKDQLDAYTKRTIMENDEKATELHFQSKNTEQLLARNQTLLEENAQLRRNLLIHKDLENELARRTHLYQKLLKKMQQRQKSDSAMAEKSMKSGDALNDSFTEEPREAAVARGLPEAGGAELAEENERLKRQVEGIQNTLKMVRHEFMQYRCDHATLTQLQDHSTRLIIATLYELKNQRECDPFPPANYDEHASWQFTTMTVRQKEYFFRVLLEKLNSSICGTCFPAATASTSLPSIVKGDGKEGGSAAHFTQFLWSVATHGPNQGAQAMAHGGHGGHGGGPRKDLVSKGCQTETDASDPCFKEGLWNPSSRARHHDAPSVTPAIVCGGVRPWGARSSGAVKPRASALGRAV